MHLPVTDVPAHDELVAALYAGVVDDNAMAQSLGRLMEAFDCKAASLVSVDSLRSAADVMIGHGLFDAAAQRRYQLAYSTDDPAIIAFDRIPVGTAAATDRLISPEIRQESRFVTEFYRPLGLAESLVGVLTRQAGRYAVIAVIRGPERASFSDREIAAFERLLPHAAQALQLRQRFFALEQRGEDLVVAIDAAGPTFLLGRDGRLRHSNIAARKLLARNDGLAITREGRLCLTQGGAGSIETAIQNALATDGPAVVAAARGRADRPYLVVIAPAANHLLVRVAELTASDSSLVALMRAAFGMTEGAARLSAELAAGANLAQCAKQAGVTLHTVRYHLRNAFAATQTRRQSDLVRIVAALRPFA